LRLYEQIRTGNRGVGAARLVGMNCQACHLGLPATEVDRIRHLPADTLARCEHCGAILVR
jgi:predicted  nucleic acid-binding Zn-ribbon protein